MIRTRARFFALCLSLLILTALISPAQASFHDARIVEIYPGIGGNPDAQYIIIMAFSNLQNQFSGVRVSVFDSTGSELPFFATFASNLPSTSTSQRSILVATQEAVDTIGITPDQLAAGSLDPNGGMVCFEKGTRPFHSVLDCLKYGSYSGADNPLSPAGTPAPLPPLGSALRRDYGILLTAADDTNDSLADMIITGPGAENFAGIGISRLAVSHDGFDAAKLDWVGDVASYTVHISADVAAVRTSVEVDTVLGLSYFASADINTVTYYIIKP